MNVTYYPGCTIKTSARNYETSARAALAWLNRELNEMEDWNCCGVVHALSVDDLFHQIAPVRVLRHFQQEQPQEELVTLCDMCYNTLSQANMLVKNNADQLKTINTFMDEEQPYDGGVTVLHLLQLLRDTIGFDAIKKKVVNPLKGLNVFPYYGCMLLRPGEIGIDDAEDPTIIGDLMQALGAEVIDDPVKVECCGSYHTVDNRDIVLERVGNIVARARAKGADAIVLSCPLCRFNMDARQPSMQQTEQEALHQGPLPVFYYTQLMCLAFGLDNGVIGLEDHQVDPLPLLREFGGQNL
jgi:heterodisulfide reductase subunit B